MTFLKRKIKRGHIWNALVVGIALSILSILPISMVSEASENAGDSNPILVRRANLTSPSGNADPHGDAGFELYQNGDKELEIEAEDLNLPDGTVLDYFVAGNLVGQATISERRADLKLKTENGDTVPNVADGATVEVKNGETLLMSGTFGNVGPTPTDTPIINRRANLTSPTGSVNPHGDAGYEVMANGDKELEIEADDLNLASGTSLDFYVDGALLGQATIAERRADFKLKSENGDTVPDVNNGSTVEVKDGGTLLMSGVFNDVGSTPTPTPTGSPSPSPTASPSPSPNGNDIHATLTGDTINGILPRGYAEYKVNGGNEREFEVYVDRVNLPIGMQLEVFVDGTSVGQLILEEEGEGELELESEDGHTVPVITDGSTVEIKNGETVILSGAFNVGGGNPTPTPTPGGQGRSFEGHLNGSNVEPPVSTNGRGEVEIFLNQNETEATVIGEYDDLSSSQTSAVINLTIGSVTTVVFDLGTLGGTEGHFAQQTFSVTPEQVQQLRTGLWYAVVGSQNHPEGEIAGQIEIDSSNSDFDGDGSNDLSVFRPSSGTWFAQNSEGVSVENFGTASDTPVSADFDGDGKTDKAVFKNVNGKGVWDIKRSSDNGVTTAEFGFASDKPVRGDFDGDGINDIAVFRPSTGVWYVRKSNNTGFIIVQFGIETDQPIAGDFDGDGKTDIAVWRESTGVWYWINSSNGNVGIVKWGQNGDKPVAGDFDGDGKTDLTVYRPETGVWYIYRSRDNSFDIRKFGIDEDIPVAGLYDGDDKTDIAVFRPSEGIWYIWNSGDSSFQIRQFGLTGDIPTITQ